MMVTVDNSQRGLALPALRTVREHKGMSQEDLAVQAGVTRATIANIERGVTRARPSSAYKLAEALKVYVDVLTGALPLPGDEPAESEGVLSTYFAAAMRHAVYRSVRGEQERVYAAIPGIDGLWARGFTRDEAERDLREALEWFVLTAVFEHRPLPAFEGTSLEITEESREGTAVIYPEATATRTTMLDDLGTEGNEAITAG